MHGPVESGLTERTATALYLHHLCRHMHVKLCPGCEVRCQEVPNQHASSLRQCFVEATPTVEKALSSIVLESGPTRSLVAELLQRLSLALLEFRAAREERYGRGYGLVRAKL